MVKTHSNFKVKSSRLNISDIIQTNENEDDRANAINPTYTIILCKNYFRLIILAILTNHHYGLNKATLYSSNINNIPVDNLDQISVGLYFAISSLNTSKRPNLDVA